MAKLDPTTVFAQPTFRRLLGVIVLMWVVLGVLLAIATLNQGVAATDPLLTPIFYLIVFGGGSLWVLWQYRRRQVNLKMLVGPWPEHPDWPAWLGLWMASFMFSLGAFQLSFVALSYWSPDWVTTTLAESLFLDADATAIPWLYNLLMVLLLVVAAPVLEEFLFRGFLLHRWGTRWNPPLAVLLTSVLFGVLHGNVIGLTLFGLVLALLYLRTNSLGVAIAIHALNNAIAASLEVISRFTGNTEPTSLEDFRAGIWFGAILLGVSLPFLVKFIRRSWPTKDTPLPYWANRDRTLAP
ncbi:CPBP family intramembrane glutamic endopeptidase [Leptolyngbya iicbica]|uniref:CPBP family intramembrane metalloprotease n=2 Tax=Cyanophyceae TaxID=3028117 RepID=A0A4Q7EDN0_9CYAN|nr:type II CAAX endopeptidase family protein [Leptolyngbya sp. LK]RZM81884.1 CPBP family intramembrane metalloprotease [Leptolyngbya sp. LK]